MKKLLLTILAIGFCFAGVARAEEGGIYFKAGAFRLTYPFATTNAIALYDIWQGVGLLGMETRVANWQAVNLNIGAVTSFEANGAPFASVDFDFARIIANVPATLAHAGVWIGRDFDRGAYMAGVKAAVPLW